MIELNKIYNQDCLEGLKLLEDNSVDSIVTDPPYELGFMGKSWDNTGIANNKEMWAECLRVLKPGGYLLSFGGTRTYHRMASAIEDAGFEVRDMIEWVYGSGFPKSLNIGKAVDKVQGNEREVVGEKPTLHHGTKDNVQKYGFATEGNIEVTKGTSEWEGWGTALKPAHEPICMARKPLAEKTVAENVLKWGTGGINIDGCRIELQDGEDKISATSSTGFNNNTYELGTGRQYTNKGRFSANLIHDNSEEVRECFPESNNSGKKLGVRSANSSDFFFKGGNNEGIREFGDSGSASRFFKSIIYTAKASKSERNKGCEGLEEKFAPKGNNEGRDMDNPKNHLGGMQSSKAQNNHPTVKPTALMQYLIKMVTLKGGIVLDPFAGSGSTLVAAKYSGYNYIGFELSYEYIEIANARLKQETIMMDKVIAEVLK